MRGLFTILLAFALTACSPGGQLERDCSGTIINAGLGTSGWPQLGGDAANRSFAPGPGPSQGVVRTTVQIGNDLTPPVLGESAGRVYLALGNAGLQVYDGESPAWTRPGTIDTIPVVGAGGDVYITDAGGTVARLDSVDGSPRWTGTVTGTPGRGLTISPSGLLLVGTSNALHAFDTGGGLQWTVPVSGGVQNVPVISQDAEIIVLDGDGLVTAYDAAGISQWDYVPPASPTSALTVDGGCTIYFAGSDNQVHAFAQEGFPRFSADLGGPVIAGPAVRPGGGVYVAVDVPGLQPQLVSVDSFGGIRQLAPIPPPVALAVDTNDVVYVVTGAGGLARVATPGNLQWNTPLGSDVSQAIALTGDGAALLGTQDGRLVRIE